MAKADGVHGSSASRLAFYGRTLLAMVSGAARTWVPLLLLTWDPRSGGSLDALVTSMSMLDFVMLIWPYSMPIR